ncbi:MAG: AGE family epimerase/isomerase, partial [bacterium]
PMIGMGPRMITIVTAQELRANLGDDPVLTVWIDRCIEEIRRWFVKPEIRCVMESVGPDGEILDHFDGRTLNPGHAIEGAWFIMQEGRYRNDAGIVRLGCDMLDWMWERGWDREYGGIFYFRDVYGKPVQEYWHDMKFWWPHDEAIIATLMAWLLTGEEKYERMHRQVHDWSHKHFADPEHGEWYGYLHRDGRVSTSLKGNLWKSFFHHPRMQWTCWQLLEAGIR